MNNPLKYNDPSGHNPANVSNDAAGEEEEQDQIDSVKEKQESRNNNNNNGNGDQVGASDTGYPSANVSVYLAPKNGSSSSSFLMAWFGLGGEQKEGTLNIGKIHQSTQQLVDILIEDEWTTVAAIGDALASLIGVIPDHRAKALSVIIDSADVASVQSRRVVTGQNYLNEVYEYDTLYKGVVNEPRNWVEYPGVRSNPVLIKSGVETIWVSRKTQYRTCVSRNFGCNNND
jgi:hypothetical protein